MSGFKFVRILAVLLVSSVVINSTIVNTVTGPVRGKLLKFDNHQYNSYQGIPYAEPPISELRFKPPVSKSPWIEILNATREGSPCPQRAGTYTESQMSEDCLFINIYSPKGFDHTMPVLFWIHGGEFSSLSGSEDIFGPQLLMKYGVILVTLNYRLGALGFLSLDIEEASGNAGLKDVVLALKWTKENIAYFGGNPKEITIGGQSAGSVIAHYLMLTKTTDGLFKQAILHSGSALGFRFFNPNPSINAFKLGSQLGLHPDNKYDLLEDLKDIDAINIIKATDANGINDDRKGFRPYGPFVPNAEIESAHAFITQEPLQIIKSGIPQNYRVLAGFNENEGIKMLKETLKNQTLIDELNENFERCIPTDIVYGEGSSRSIALANDIREFYFDGKNITASNLNDFVDLITDTQFAHSIDYWIRLHKSRETSEKIFYYKFKYDGELNWFKIQNNIDYPGTAHGDDLGYLFYTEKTKDSILSINETTKLMLNNMLVTTTNFVKYGMPTPHADFHTGNFIWKESDLPEMNYLKLEPVMSNSHEPPVRDRTQYWEDVYTNYYISTT